MCVCVYEIALARSQVSRADPVVSVVDRTKSSNDLSCGLGQCAEFRRGEKAIHKRLGPCACFFLRADAGMAELVCGDAGGSWCGVLQRRRRKLNK